jgi:hypothetical protein
MGMTFVIGVGLVAGLILGAFLILVFPTGLSGS